ncbi:sigma-E factor negative regulatory protein [Halomonas beimenensis]|uniref:Sigma factor RpoE negative regulatory protein RseA n=1 Tax=Halomonas beimenensis TaxID=475662 RepID=A0A291P5X4_9GAMM|nr:RseA family anti-sigma factor [Halomonas beimenensis]ATJ82271.1 sigma factor RpoE negative regulatory protein RseA [Halomonas beimenensis]
MSQNARESLSALMDDEGDELELRRVLKSLEDEPDAADAWRRYHLMRSLMRRETDADVATDLSAGIMARLQDEPAPTPAASELPRRSLPLARSAGIAAAVSLLVITGVQFYNGASPLGGDEAAVAAAAEQAEFPTDDRMPSLVDLPMFQTPTAGNAGLMTVGAGEAMPMMLSPSQRQSLRMDRQQALLLQSYLDRHAEGAAASGGDVWMPLLRASGSETLGQR